jgi:hypothetical protein
MDDKQVLNGLKLNNRKAINMLFDPVRTASIFYRRNYAGCIGGRRFIKFFLLHPIHPLYF